MDVMDLIAARLAAPKNFRVVTVYASGNERIHETETLAQAENWATRERCKIGKKLIKRETGETVQVTEVRVEEIK